MHQREKPNPDPHNSDAEPATLYCSLPHLEHGLYPPPLLQLGLHGSNGLRGIPTRSAGLQSVEAVVGKRLREVRTGGVAPVLCL
jgi:hypothetical protein